VGRGQRTPAITCVRITGNTEVSGNRVEMSVLPTMQKLRLSFVPQARNSHQTEQGFREQCLIELASERTL
jgi:hypothetical protein